MRLLKFEADDGKQLFSSFEFKSSSVGVVFIKRVSTVRPKVVSIFLFTKAFKRFAFKSKFKKTKKFSTLNFLFPVLIRIKI